MKFSEKDLDALLWDWAADTIKAQDSGYPSNYEIGQRVDCGVVFVPDYFPRPKVCRIAQLIFELEREYKNIIVAKYLFCWKIQEIAKYNGCHNATVYRKLAESRRILVDEMREFTYHSLRV